MRKSFGVVMAFLTLITASSAQPTSLSTRVPGGTDFRSAIRAPFPAIAPAAASPMALNMAPMGGGGLGITVNDADGVVANQLFDGTIEERSIVDLAVLNVLAPGTGSMEALTGIAWDPNLEVYHVVDATNQLFQVDRQGVLQAGPFLLEDSTPTQDQVVGGLDYDATTGQLVGKDIVNDRLVTWAIDGTRQSELVDPLSGSAVFGPAFGNAACLDPEGNVVTATGIGILGSDCFTGPTSLLTLDRATGQKIAGHDGNLDDLINTVGATFVNGIDISTDGRVFLVDDATGMVYEVTNTLQPCAFATASDLVAMETMPGSFEVTGMDNDSDEINLYVNGVLNGTFPGFPIFVDLPGGEYVFDTEGVMGAAECGGFGDPVFATSTALSVPNVCPDASKADLVNAADNTTILAMNSISCTVMGTNINAGTGFGQTFQHDVFSVTGPYTIDAIEFGIETALAGVGFTEQPAQITLGLADSQIPTMANINVIAEGTVDIPNTTLGTYCLDPGALAAGPVVVDPALGDYLVVILEIPNGVACGHAFFMGSNNGGEAAPSLLVSAGCGITELTPVTALGVGAIENYVINVHITEMGSGTNAIRGDADNDGMFTGIADGLFTLNAQFVPGSPQPECLDAADSNGDGQFIGIADGLYALNAQFVPGSPPPPSPFPDCGPIDLVLGCANPVCP